MIGIYLFIYFYLSYCSSAEVEAVKDVCRIEPVRGVCVCMCATYKNLHYFFDENRIKKILPQVYKQRGISHATVFKKLVYLQLIYIYMPASLVSRMS